MSESVDDSIANVGVVLLLVSLVSESFFSVFTEDIITSSMNSLFNKNRILLDGWFYFVRGVTHFPEKRFTIHMTSICTPRKAQPCWLSSEQNLN